LPKQQQKEKELTVDEVKKMIYKQIEKKQKQITKPDLMTEQIFGKSVNKDLKDIIHNLSGNWILLN
jgi:hypothetical protein